MKFKAVFVIVFVIFLLWVLTTVVLAQGEPPPSAESGPPLDCLSCHTRVLESHDKLGSGSEACWVCHDSINIGMLRLADGTRLPLEDSSQICSQCHQKRYDAWQEGAHGVPAGRKEVSGVPLTAKVKCIACHNPHQPQIALTDITRSPPVSAVPGKEAPLECLSCHTRVLKGHDKLGSGSKACWACHSNIKMGELHLADGQEKLSLADYPRLCAQCHQNRYEDWVEGTHGAPAWKEGLVEIHGDKKVGCIGCHDPHQPQIVLLDITKPHPEPAPPPPSPPANLLIMLGISLLLIGAFGVAMAKQGKGL